MLLYFNFCTALTDFTQSYFSLWVLNASFQFLQCHQQCQMVKNEMDFFGSDFWITFLKKSQVFLDIQLAILNWIAFALGDERKIQRFRVSIFWKICSIGLVFTNWDTLEEKLKVRIWKMFLRLSGGSSGEVLIKSGQNSESLTRLTHNRQKFWKHTFVTRSVSTWRRQSEYLLC